MRPSAICLEPSASIARKVATHIKSADFHVYDVRDDAEAEGVLVRLEAEGLGSRRIIRSPHVRGRADQIEETFSRIVIVTERWRSSELVLAEFEELINSAPAERDLHDFFDRNPHFLMASGYDAAWSEPVLHRADSRSYIKPDFVITRSLGNDHADESRIIDFKRADVSVLDRRRHQISPSHAATLSHAVTKVMTQLEDYGDYFADPRTRTRFERSLVV
jgi:hypothetical protein